MHPHDGRVVSNFVVSALTGRPLTIYGEGQQTRSFQYIDDLIAGLIAMMRSDDEVTGPINLGNPGEFTIAELAAMVLEQTGSDSGSSTCRCRRTIRSVASPTSLARRRLSAGSPRSR